MTKSHRSCMYQHWWFEHYFKIMKQSYWTCISKEQRLSQSTCVCYNDGLNDWEKVWDFLSSLKTTVSEGLNNLTTLMTTTLSIGESNVTKAIDLTRLCKENIIFTNIDEILPTSFVPFKLNVKLLEDFRKQRWMIWWQIQLAGPLGQ